MKTSSYVFGAAIAVSGVMSMADQAMAASITAAAFTFETSAAALNTLNVTAPAVGPLIAESGVGSAFGSHVATGTVYSSPAGNGSLRSLSSNNFVAGDYYQFSVPTSNLQDIAISFDQIASSTGPKVFSLAYSTNGTSYSPFSTYLLNSSTAASSFSTAGNTAVRFAFDLSGITGLNNDALASFRLVEADTTTATGGTSRIDNVVIAGNTFVATPGVPEPASLTLVAAGIVGLGSRRRRD